MASRSRASGRGPVNSIVVWMLSWSTLVKLVSQTLSASDRLHFVEASVTNIAAIVAGIRQSRKHKFEQLRSSTSRVWPVYCVKNHTNKPCRLAFAYKHAECNAAQQG